MNENESLDVFQNELCFAFFEEKHEETLKYLLKILMKSKTMILLNGKYNGK